MGIDSLHPGGREVIWVDTFPSRSKCAYQTSTLFTSMVLRLFLFQILKAVTEEVMQPQHRVHAKDISLVCALGAEGKHF